MKRHVAHTIVLSVLGLLLVASTAVVSMLDAQGAEMPAQRGMSCSDTKVSSMTVKVSGRSRTVLWVYNNGNINTIYDRTTRNFNAGSVKVTVIACKHKGKWRALRYSLDDRHADLTLTVKNGKISNVKPAGGRSQGWGVFATRLTASKLSLSGRTCAREPRKLSALGVTHAVLSLPLPLPRYWQDIAVWIADKAIPGAKSGNTYRCGAAGGFDVSWKFDGSGRAKITKITGSSQTIVRGYRASECGRLPQGATCAMDLRTSLTARRA